MKIICLDPYHVIYVAPRSVNTCTLICADAFFSSALDGVHWSVSRLGRFFVGIKVFGTVKIGFVGPKNRSGCFGGLQGVFSDGNRTAVHLSSSLELTRCVLSSSPCNL
jgi:hypothetical protein